MPTHGRNDVVSLDCVGSVDELTICAGAVTTGVTTMIGGVTTITGGTTIGVTIGITTGMMTIGVGGGMYTRTSHLSPVYPTLHIHDVALYDDV